MKKLISIMMGFVLVAQLLMCQATAAVEDSEPADAVTEVELDANAKKLLALGLLEESQLSHGDETVTKGEFCAIVVKLFALEQFMSSPEVTYFFDVPITHPYIKEICFLYEACVINGTGDDCFGADEPVTFNAALTILLRALGYENIAQREGGYPIGYYRVADRYGLLDDLSIGGNEQLKATVMYKLLANCAETLVCEVFPVGNGVEYTVEEGNNLLWAHHKIVSKTGVVTANGYSTLAKPRAKIVDCIGIDGKDYTCNNEGFYGLLGKSVKYYVQEIDGEEMVVYVEEYRNETLTIDAEDIVNATKKEITYLVDGEKEETYSIDTYCDVLYNGVALTGYGALNSIMPVCGYMELIDNDHDYKAEVILINEGKDIIINNIDKESETVYDKLTNASIFLGTSGSINTYMALTDGTEIRFGQLEIGDIVSIYESKNTSGVKIKNIIISRNFISGKITELKDNNIYVIEGVEYRKSAEYTEELQVGTSGIFYLNHKGRIVLQRNAESTDMKFGVVVGTEYEEFRGELTVRLFTQDGEFANFDCADRVAYTYGSESKNGKLEDTAYVSNLRALLVQGEVVMYRVSEDGGISEFNIVDENATAPTEFNLLDKSNTFQYYSGYVHGRFLIDGKTVIFSLPDDLTKEEEYAILQQSAFNVNVGELMQNKYSAYYLGETRLVPACAMKIENFGRSGSIARSTPLAVVAEMSTGLKDDEEVCLLNVLYNGKKVKLYLTDEEKNRIKTEHGYVNLSLDIGDVIRYSADLNGEINDIEIIYDGSTDGTLAPPTYELNGKLANSNDFRNLYRVLYGIVEEVNSNGIFSYTIPYSASFTDIEKDGPVLEMRQIGTARIMKILTERGKVEFGTSADINPDDIVIIRSQYGAPSDIVVIKQ